MNKFFKTIQNIFEIKELKDKILLTLGLIIVYRLASYITIPAIDITQVNKILDEVAQGSTDTSANGFLDLLASFTGGALNRASIMALGIMPYISASIVVQLMGHAVPYFKKLQNEGESGRKTINQITRWLTIAICLVQGFFYLKSLPNTQYLLPYGQFAAAYLVNPNTQFFLYYVPNLILLVSGTIFAMWMGEKITDKGIGNGISILIMVGIMANFPTALFAESQLPDQSALKFIFEMLLWLAVLLLCIILVTAVRKIPVQYVSQLQKRGAAKIQDSLNAARNYIPLKVNAAGVMPIIFAQALMFVPGLFALQPGQEETPTATQLFFTKFQDIFSLEYNLLFAFLIIIFTFFYTAITIPVNQMADDLKRNGGLIPKVKPGEETENYLDNILSRITFPGSIFLALLAVMPAVVHGLNLSGANFAIFFGGTSLIIMVGVILDTVQQINTYLLNHHYDGLMKTKLSRSSIS